MDEVKSNPLKDTPRYKYLRQLKKEREIGVDPIYKNRRSTVSVEERLKWQSANKQWDLYNEYEGT